MANPNIYGQFAQPVRSFQDYSNEIERGRFLQNQNAIQQAAMADRQQAQAAGQQRQNALMAIAQGTGGDPAKMVPALYQGGFVAEAQALEKHGADIRKSGSESAGRDAETENKVIGAYRDLATNITSPQEAAELVTAMRGDPRLANSPIARVPLDQAIAQIGQDPQALQSWKQQFSLGAEKYITQNKPQYITSDLGGKVQTMAAPGLGGAPTVVSDSAKTMTPGESARLNEERRQFGIREARQTATDSATVGKPFEVTGPDGVPILVRQDKQGNIHRVEGFGPKAGAGKPLNDAQSKALLFGSRMQESDKILTDLESQGVMRPGAISQTAQTVAGLVPFMGDKFSEVAATATNFTQSAEQQRVDQARRDFINAVLRRESGAVISPSEFANAERQYFPAAGDKPEQIAQKRRNRQLATRGILQEVPEGQRNSLSSAQPKANTQSASGVVEWGDLK